MSALGTDLDEQTLASLFEAFPVGLAVVDQRLRLVGLNPQLAATLGVRPEAVTGRPLRDALLPDLGPPLEEAVRLALARGEPVKLDLRAGERRFQASVAALAGREAAGVTLTELLTQTRRRDPAMLEEALRRSQEQLHQARRLEAVGRLAGGIAHDFNNLLTAIMGYCDLLLMRIERTSPLREDVEEVRKAGKRAAALVQQLLAFSRKQVLQPKVIDLNHVVADLEPMLRRLIPESIDLVVRPTADLWRTRADPGQLQQVIVNLVVNARDAMPAGGRLVLETKNVEPDELTDEEQVVLSVKDTGSGMTPEVLAHLFEPFFTTKPAGTGTGLGLATVYGIVHQSGGRVEARSEPGQGSCFEVYLPRSALDTPTPSPSSTHLAIAPRGSETVLVVEDDAAVRTLARSVLLAGGYTVLVAGDAAQARAVADAHAGRLDLLVTDVVLPGPNGPQLFEELRRRRPWLKVLYVSGHSQHAVEHHGVPAEHVAFLGKPFTPAALAREVRAVLDGQHALR